MLEDLRRAFAKSGFYPRRARGLLDALYTRGTEGFADPADRATWRGIFGDAVRLWQLYDEVRQADAAQMRHAFEAREAGRAIGEYPAAWHADHELALQDTPDCEAVMMPPWVERESRTAAAIRRVAGDTAAVHPAVASIILYGSLARGDMRLLDDPDPSDVDLLILALLPAPDTADATVAAEPIIRTIRQAADQGACEAAQSDPEDLEIVGQRVKRDLEALVSPWDLASAWDSLFVETVNADGIVLWTRQPLPEALEPLARRAGLPIMLPPR